VFADGFGQLVLGWLLADFLTGAFHWWEDRVARIDMPILGRWLIEPNRLHHVDPLAFTRGSFAQRSQAAIVAVAACSAIWLLAFGPSVFWVAVTMGGACATEVHRMAHERKRGGAFGALQDIGLIQSPTHHAGHHRGEFDQRYCVLTGWLNPILDRMHFWHHLERRS
jgi:sterol desaturase/sphingolipid hydroxylase (fatty acid hydroxylase superfamily)